MNMVLDATPVPFVNPFNQAFETMPLAMVNAYVPYASHLNLKEAAKVAAIRDEENATTLLLSIKQVNLFAPIVEEADYLTIQPPSLR